MSALRAPDALGSSDPPSPDRPTIPAASPTPAPPDPGSQPALEDTSTKHASVELAGYNDNDHVTVVTPSIAMGIDNVSGASLKGTYLVDVVSAASVDIVSTASPRWREVRQAGSLSASYKPRDFGVTVGGSFSSEPDYLSYGGYALVTKDFNEKNLSLSFGYGFSHDTIGICGDNGICTAFSVFSRPLQRGSFNAGVDFVVNDSTLASVVGDVIIENGDQSKPYRYVPMFSPMIAPTVAKGASIDWVIGHLSYRSLEQLPLEHQRFALTGRMAHRFETSTLRLEERLYRDSWGLFASSTDVRWIFDLGKRFAVWPHLRLHWQTPVSFWQLAYVSTPTPWVIPEYRTGDRELGPLWTGEGGFGVKWYLGSAADPNRWALQLTGDAMYTDFLDDLYVTSRVATLGAVGFEGTF